MEQTINSSLDAIDAAADIISRLFLMCVARATMAHIHYRVKNP